MPETVTQYRAAVPAAPDAENQEPNWGTPTDSLDLARADAQVLAQLFSVNLIEAYIESREVAYGDWSRVQDQQPAADQQPAPEQAPAPQDQQPAS